MNKIELLVSDFEEFNDAFALWSIIYIRIGNQCFPDNRWWDATSTILEMWISNVELLIKRTKESVELDFMDGDYAINLTCTSKNNIDVECVTPQGDIVLHTTTDLLYFSKQLLGAVERVKEYYSESLDTPSLKSLLAASKELEITVDKYRADDSLL